MTRGRTSPALRAAAVAAGLLPLVALALLPLIPPQPEPPPAAPEEDGQTVLFDLPEAGGTAVRALAGGETHRYRFAAEAGTYLEIAVEQRGVDLAVALAGTGGETLRQTDTPINDRGTERLVALVDDGEHAIELHPFTADADGRYALTVRARRPATAADRDRAAAAAAFAAAESAWWSGDATAADLYRRALPLQQAAGDRFGEAESHDRLGRLARGAGERRLAIEHHAVAAELYAKVGDDQREAIARTHRASALYELGEVDAAEAGYLRALPLARAAGDAAAEAVVHHGLAAVLQVRGDPAAALAAFERSLDLHRDHGGRQAEALYDSGRLLVSLGDHAGARRRFEQAAALCERLGDERGRARALQELAYVDLWLGDPETAAQALERILELHRAHGDRQSEALALVDLAVVARSRGDHLSARRRYREAGEIFAGLGRPSGLGIAERGLARTALALGEVESAEAHAARALDLYRRLGDPDGEAASLSTVAAAAGAAAEAAGPGDEGEAHLARALAAAERSVALTEGLRRRTPGAAGDDLATDLRATFQASVRDRYELWIDLEMAAHRRHPRAGHAARAFEIGERARARSLLDLLSRRGGVADPVADAETARRQLDGTVVLAYSLGRRRSWLWRLDDRGLAVWELPPRLEVHAIARRAVELLRRSHRRETRSALADALCDAAETLLAPAAADGGLGDGRLAVIGEGILHFLPFAALPDPASGDCAAAPPLVEGHELVALPSLATLDLLRRRHAGRRPAAGALAAVADPVFGTGDPRLAGLALEPPAETAADEDLPRLPASRNEAAAAVAQARAHARGATLLATGFEASEDLFTSGRLARYRVVHLATHARVDGDRPRRSGIALSRFDAAGHRRDGFLDATEIHRLDLPAELVVLSGCRTALGRRVTGEGLVGFSRGFLDAGAPRLLVSLWSVDDRATAELMSRFYEHLFADRLPPDAALATAQRGLAADPRWRAPYHWAGFQLVGEWRGWDEGGG